MVNINIKIPEDIHKQLKIEAINKNMTLKEHIISKLRVNSKNSNSKNKT